MIEAVYFYHDDSGTRSGTFAGAAAVISDSKRLRCAIKLQWRPNTARRENETLQLTITRSLNEINGY